MSQDQQQNQNLQPEQPEPQNQKQSSGEQDTTGIVVEQEILSVLSSGDNWEILEKNQDYAVYVKRYNDNKRKKNRNLVRVKVDKVPLSAQQLDSIFNNMSHGDSENKRTRSGKSYFVDTIFEKIDKSTGNTYLRTQSRIPDIMKKFNYIDYHFVKTKSSSSNAFVEWTIIPCNPIKDQSNYNVLNDLIPSQKVEFQEQAQKILQGMLYQVIRFEDLPVSSTLNPNALQLDEQQDVQDNDKQSLLDSRITRPASSSMTISTSVILEDSLTESEKDESLLLEYITYFTTKQCERIPACSTLSVRGLAYHNMPAFFQPLAKCFADPYHPKTNPNGYINLGIAENVICNELMVEKFKSIRSQHPINAKNFTYGDFTGSFEFRSQVAKLFHKHVCKLPDKVGINPHCIVACNGAGTVVEQLVSTLCDPGDIVLISSPLYHGLENDLNKRSQCRQFAVPLKEQLISSNTKGQENKEIYTFKIDFEQLEADYSELCKVYGKQAIKAFLYVNPHNPTGVIFSEAETKMLMKWCIDRKMHFISDEVYALSTYPDEEFTSALTIMKQDEGNTLLQTYVHVIYSFSKDFGLNGFRVGILYTENYDVLVSMRACSYFTSCSTDTIELLYHALSDDKFIDHYIKENQRRLQAMFNKLSHLMELNSIPYCRSNSGMFLYANLSKALKANVTVLDEKKLWNKLLSADENIKVNLMPGFVFQSPIPGWFRCCISAIDEETTMIAWQRVINALKPTKLS